MKTIAEIVNSAKEGDILTDGKRKWRVVDDGSYKIALPLKYTRGTFELWSEGGMEKYAVLPGLRISE